MDSTKSGKVLVGSFDFTFAPAGGATPEAVAWPDPPSLLDAEDSDTYNMGLEFSITAGSDGSWVGNEWNPAPLTNVAPAGGSYIAKAWNSDTTELASKIFTPTPGVKNQVMFDTPVTVTPGVSYIASMYTKRYVFLSNIVWNQTSPSGRIHADKGRLTSDNSGVGTFPGGSYQAIYFISPLIVFPT
jgi:hypothetical protein